MGIPGFFKWLTQQFPECIIHDKSIYSHCQTLFIDLCQITFRADEFVKRKMKQSNSQDRINVFLSELTKRVKSTILTINPHDLVFAFLDGPNPAIKFQRQRERWFRREHIDNYVIDPSEYKLSDINTDLDDLTIEKLQDFFVKITNNCKFLRAKRILFSTTYAPGEAEHKYFEVFRNYRHGAFWKPNQLHSIFSTDNDLIFLALQFLDDHFLVIRDFDTIVDVLILRDLLLYQMFQKDLYFSMETNKENNKLFNENRTAAAFQLVSLIPNDIKQQVIDDIIALSFIVGNDFLPPIPDFSAIFSFSNLLNSYKRINEKYFLSIISSNIVKSDKLVFTRLIVGNCFDVSSLQRIIDGCINHPKRYDNQNTNDNSRNNDTAENGMNLNNEDNNNNNNNEDSNTANYNTNNENTNDDNTANDNTNNDNTNNDNTNNDNTNNDNTNNDNTNNDNNNNDDNNNDNDNDNDNNNSTNNDNNNANDETIKLNANTNTNTGKKNIKKAINNREEAKTTKINDSEELQEASQQVLRVFNFTWNYYSSGCLSWSYYFPYKDAPPLRKAIYLMKQEGIEVFQTEDSMKKTEPIFKRFILHPVESKEDIPWCLYKLKIPPSEICNFWPLGAKNVTDVPMFDLQIVRSYYEEGKKLINQDELKYNRCDPIYYTYYNNNHRNKRYK